MVSACNLKHASSGHKPVSRKARLFDSVHHLTMAREPHWMVRA